MVMVLNWCNYYSFLHAVPDPQSVSLSSDPVTPVISGRDVTLVCTVRMSQDHIIMDSEIFLLMADSQIFRPDGTPLTTTGPSVTGTTFTFTAQLNSFGRSDSGNYTCNATVRAQPSAMYLTGIATMVVTARITRITTGRLIISSTGLKSLYELFYNPLYI